MWVVKLGGSLYGSDLLRDWLDRLATVRRPLVVVPGGGPFADQVRAAQARYGFGDAGAHRMAVLAMGQMAYLLCALHPAFVAAADPAAMQQAIARRRVPVWLPADMVLGEPAIAEDWRVTSDSLALWLAGRLQAQAVLLVKSAALPGMPPLDVARLQNENLLDRAFHDHARRSKCPVWLIHRGHAAALDAVLDGRPGPALALAI